MSEMKVKNIKRGFSFLIFPLSLFLFWLFIFTLFRGLFLYTYYNDISSLMGFWKGIKLDVSAACFLLALPSFLWLINQFKNTRLLSKLSLIISLILLFCLILIELSSIFLFKEWGTTINERAITYLFQFEDGAKTTAEYITLSSTLTIIFFFLLGGIILTKIHSQFKTPSPSLRHKVITSILILGFLVIGMRGGLQKIPLNIGEAFYSNNQTENYLSVNKTYYFIKSVLQKNVSKHIDYKDQLESFKSSLYPDNPSLKIELFDLPKPNIVFVVLEGCPSIVFENLGKTPEITPNFSSLCDSGLLFNQIYSSGFRTDQGLLSIFSGIPAIPYKNLMANVEKSSSFPSLFKDFKNEGYYTSFIYGGDVNFSNLSAYFNHSNIDQLLSKDDFDPDKQLISWGVPDEFVFNRMIKELTNQPTPFFTGMITQSTHQPFDYNFTQKFSGDSEEVKYKNAVSYMDSCLGDFLKKAQQENWYDSTIFVIVSDHGSMHLTSIDFNSHERFHVPLLFIGHPLKNKWKGKEISTIGNSHDIPSTLLSSLHLADEDYELSKNLLDSTLNHAYWITEHTLGWIIPTQKLVLNHEKKEVYFIENEMDTSSKLNALLYYNLVKQMLNN